MDLLKYWVITVTKSVLSYRRFHPPSLETGVDDDWSGVIKVRTQPSHPNGGHAELMQDGSMTQKGEEMKMIIRKVIVRR